MENNRKNLTVILPAKGRLKDDFKGVRKAAGFEEARPSERIDQGKLVDLRGSLPDIDAMFERADDALRTLAEGAADLAIVGRDALLEFNRASRAANPRFPDNNINALLKLEGVSACRLCIAGPKNQVLEKENALAGLRIATPFPAILKAWLGTRNITPAAILVRSGGTEATIGQGRADVICDLVRTGETLEANGLDSKFTVEKDISAVVVGRVGLWDAEKSDLARAFLQRLENAAKTMQAPEAAPAPVYKRLEIF